MLILLLNNEAVTSSPWSPPLLTLITLSEKKKKSRWSINKERKKEWSIFMTIQGNITLRSGTFKDRWTRILVPAKTLGRNS